MRRLRPAGSPDSAMSSVDLRPSPTSMSEAFDPLSCDSLEALTRTLRRPHTRRSVRMGQGWSGYQLSTGSPPERIWQGSPVRPAAQRRGLGAALVGDLIAHLPTRGRPRLTVNTQSKNAASLSLYDGLSFRLTGEHYPVYILEVQSAGADFEHRGD